MSEEHDFLSLPHVWCIRITRASRPGVVRWVSMTYAVEGLDTPKMTVWGSWTHRTRFTDRAQAMFELWRARKSNDEGDPFVVTLVRVSRHAKMALA